MKFLFGFFLFLYFNIFIVINIQWSKQPHYIRSFLWNLYFAVCFCYFWKDKSLVVLNLFIFEYLDQIPPWKEMIEPFSVKLQTKNRCFCLSRSKLNKAQTAQITNTIQFSSTLIKISGHITEWKKIGTDQRFRKYFCILEIIRAKQGVGKQVRFVPNTIGQFGRQQGSQPRKLLYK